MEDLQVIGEFVRAVAVIIAFVTGILVMALADVGMTVLLLKWSSKIRKASKLPSPRCPCPNYRPTTRWSSSVAASRSGNSGPRADDLAAIVTRGTTPTAPR